MIAFQENHRVRTKNKHLADFAGCLLEIILYDIKVNTKKMSQRAR